VGAALSFNFTVISPFDVSIIAKTAWEQLRLEIKLALIVSIMTLVYLVNFFVSIILSILRGVKFDLNIASH
jgi:hypothetical protein